MSNTPPEQMRVIMRLTDVHAAMNKRPDLEVFDGKEREFEFGKVVSLTMEPAGSLVDYSNPNSTLWFATHHKSKLVLAHMHPDNVLPLDVSEYVEVIIRPYNPPAKETEEPTDETD